MSPFDQALSDFYYNQSASELTLHNNYGDPETMPIEVFFRDEYELSDLDKYALSLCKGDILDIGAGVGAHTLALQNRNEKVTALEISSTACQIMKDRVVKQVINDSLYSTLKEKYDTLLILMNGFGLCGTVNNASNFFKTLGAKLKPGGKVIIDSSDVGYMYDKLPEDHYYGEVQFCYEYKHIVGEWFNWLYIDPNYLIELSNQNNWSCQVVFEDGNDQYLAILKPFKDHSS